MIKMSEMMHDDMEVLHETHNLRTQYKSSGRIIELQLIGIRYLNKDIKNRSYRVLIQNILDFYGYQVLAMIDIQRNTENNEDIIGFRQLNMLMNKYKSDRSVKLVSIIDDTLNDIITYAFAIKKEDY